MITPREFLKKLEGLDKGLTALRVDIALGVALDATDAVTDRVREDRVDDEGQMFGLYKDSTWKGKKRKLSSDRRINFSDRNLMLNHTKPSIEVVTKDQVVVRIKPLLPDREEVMGYHEDRFGKIIAFSEKELAELYADHQEEINKLIDQHLS